MMHFQGGYTGLSVLAAHWQAVFRNKQQGAPAGRSAVLLHISLPKHGLPLPSLPRATPLQDS